MDKAFGFYTRLSVTLHTQTVLFGVSMGNEMTVDSNYVAMLPITFEFDLVNLF